MKCLFLLVLFGIGPIFPSADPDFINPTGTYTLTGIVRNNRVIGHSGELRVRLLSPDKVAVCFYMNKGYPGYESGAFMDTLAYEENRVFYTPASDTGCSVLFCFLPRTVEIIKIYSDIHSGCGFGQGVLAASILDKTSSELPVIQDLSGHGAKP